MKKRLTLTIAVLALIAVSIVALVACTPVPPADVIQECIEGTDYMYQNTNYTEDDTKGTITEVDKIAVVQGTIYSYYSTSWNKEYEEDGKVLVDVMKAAKEIYYVPNGDDKYDVYTGTKAETAKNFAWQHSVMTKDEVADIMADFNEKLTELKGTLTNITAGNNIDYSGVKCNIAVSGGLKIDEIYDAEKKLTRNLVNVVLEPSKITIPKDALASKGK